MTPVAAPTPHTPPGSVTKYFAADTPSQTVTARRSDEPHGNRKQLVAHRPGTAGEEWGATRQ